MMTRGLTLVGWVPRASSSLATECGHTAVDTIVKPVLEGMIKEGRPYLGVLYAGLILTADVRPKVIEFNARFEILERKSSLPRLDF